MKDTQIDLTEELLLNGAHACVVPEKDALWTFCRRDDPAGVPYDFFAAGKPDAAVVNDSIRMIRLLCFYDADLLVAGAGGFSRPPEGFFCETYLPPKNPYNMTSFSFMGRWLEEDCAIFRQNPSRRQDSLGLEHFFLVFQEFMHCFGFWNNRLQLSEFTVRMVWNDAAAAVRLAFMTYILLRLRTLPRMADDCCELLLRSAFDHYLVLAGRSFYNGRTNHGFLQNASLLAFCHFFPEINGSASVRTLTEKRMLAMLAQRCSKEGFLKEHSTGYHARFLYWHQTLLRFPFLSETTSAVIHEHVQKMIACLYSFLLPDGTQAILGDTFDPSFAAQSGLRQYLALHPAPLPSPVTIYSSAGYGFLRSTNDADPAGASQVILCGAFHSRTHKHCDDLHCLWSEGHEAILTDVGVIWINDLISPDNPLYAKGFWYGDPKRIYAESAHAHNVVEINGQSYSRKVNPYGALPIKGGKASNTVLYLQSVWRRPEKFTQERMLLFKPKHWLLVSDALYPANSGTAGRPMLKTSFAQWFHLGPGMEEDTQSAPMSRAFKSPAGKLEITSLLPLSSVSTHFGQTDPRLQGWYARTQGELAPAWAIGLHAQGEEAHFATLFAWNSKYVAHKIMKRNKTIMLLSFADGTEDAFEMPSLYYVQ
jgi:hypothetical protein